MFAAVLVHQREVHHTCRGDARRGHVDGRVADHVTRHGAKLTELDRDLVRDAQSRGFRHVLHVARCCVVERHVHDTTRVDDDGVPFSHIARVRKGADGPVGRGRVERGVFQVLTGPRVVHDVRSVRGVNGDGGVAPRVPRGIDDGGGPWRAWSAGGIPQIVVLLLKVGDVKLALCVHGHRGHVARVDVAWMAPCVDGVIVPLTVFVRGDLQFRCAAVLVGDVGVVVLVDQNRRFATSVASDVDPLIRPTGAVM